MVPGEEGPQAAQKCERLHTFAFQSPTGLDFGLLSVKKFRLIFILKTLTTSAYYEHNLSGLLQVLIMLDFVFLNEKGDHLSFT